MKRIRSAEETEMGERWDGNGIETTGQRKLAEAQDVRTSPLAAFAAWITPVHVILAGFLAFGALVVGFAHAAVKLDAIESLTKPKVLTDEEKESARAEKTRAAEIDRAVTTQKEINRRHGIAINKLGGESSWHTLALKALLKDRHITVEQPTPEPISVEIEKETP